MAAFCAPAFPARGPPPLADRGPQRATRICAAAPSPSPAAAASASPRAAARPLRPYLEALQRGEDLGAGAGDAVCVLVDGLARGRVSAAEAGGFLALLGPTSVSGAALGAAAGALRARMRRAALDGPLLDIVGTGGDGRDTVNISTAAAIVAAAGGARVAKFGNASASSRAGSADVVSALGVARVVEDDALARCVEEAGIAFLFAPVYHPALKAVAGVRRELGVKSVFNILGPLVHPVPAGRVVLGVYDPRLLRTVAEALAGLEVESAMVVHCAGLDELCPAADASVVWVKEGRVGDVESVDMCVGGVQRCRVEELVGGDAEHNAGRIRAVLEGEKGPVADAVMLNAAAGFVVYGLEENLEDGVARARRAIESGAAMETLRRWIAASNAE